MAEFFSLTKKRFQHWFSHTETNHWKPKYLHNDFLTYLILALLLVNFSFRFALGHVDNRVLGVSIDISVSELLKDTNEQRVKAGLSPLVLNEKLSQAASLKAKDMFNNNYWAHFSPTGVSPWYFFEQVNYNYEYAGENLAKDFSTSSEVISAWMNSQKHRENILKKDYQDVGFAIVEGNLLGQPTILVVQEFGSPTGQLANNQQTNNNSNASTLSNASNQSPTTKNSSGKQTMVEASVIKNQPLVDLAKVQKQLVFLVLAGLIIALSLDLYFMEKQKLYRFSGKHLAKLLFVGFFIISILLVKSGTIL